ncbi:hypothetical protein [Subtercola vilae]|uniref:Holin n=1 Tax=Subtercola vilae TaxID=2056433 RepID=A0A4T2BTJ7_9MICO|nr:hypothetical protein [Subtercola vilae]TIH34985.1 hypothetical protein D4765_11875 [Subtercola vilae]
MSQITVQSPKVTITRELKNLAPKVLTFLATGVTASGLAYVLGTAGITLTPALTSLLVVLISAVAGYLKADTTLLSGGLPVSTTTAPVAPVSLPGAHVDVTAPPVVAAPVATAPVVTAIPAITFAPVPAATFDQIVTPVPDQVTSV